MLEKVTDASVKWFELGLALNLSHDELTKFRDQYRGDNDACLRETLAFRLNSRGPLTWRDICTALRSPTVKRNTLADEIESQYIESTHIHELMDSIRIKISQHDCVEFFFV